MEVSVYNINGQDTGKKITLSDDVFAVEPNEHVVYLDVKQHLANARQGTHKSKERGEIKGSTKKIKRQKGTGTARAGSIKNPLFRGGGRAFGPRPRDYGFKLNKKVKKLARKSVLSSKLADSKLVVVEDFEFDTPKTKNIVNTIKNLNIEEKKQLFILSKENKAVYLSARNLGNVQISTPSELTTYDLANNGTIIITESAVDLYHSALGKQN